MRTISELIASLPDQNSTLLPGAVEARQRQSLATPRKQKIESILRNVCTRLFRIIEAIHHAYWIQKRNKVRTFLRLYAMNMFSKSWHSVTRYFELANQIVFARNSTYKALLNSCNDFGMDIFDLKLCASTNRSLRIIEPQGKRILCDKVNWKQRTKYFYTRLLKIMKYKHTCANGNSSIFQIYPSENEASSEKKKVLLRFDLFQRMINHPIHTYHCYCTLYYLENCSAEKHAVASLAGIFGTVKKIL